MSRWSRDGENVAVTVMQGFGVSEVEDKNIGVLQTPHSFADCNKLFTFDVLRRIKS